MIRKLLTVLGATAALWGLSTPVLAHATTQLDHVVVVIGENNTRQVALQNSYLASLAKTYGDAQGSTAITHPSLPNYLALTGGSTFGVTNDAGPSSHPIKGQSIFGQTSGRTLAESMPSNCQTGSDTTLYSTHHNPQVYYVDEAALCKTNDIPYTKGTTPNLSAPYTFVTPNKCDDGHNACNGVPNTAVGRVGEYANFVKSFLPLAMKTPQWTSSRTAIVLTFDEGSNSSQNVYTVVISNQLKGVHRVLTTKVTHYSLLGTIEDMLGKARLRNAVGAPSMKSLFVP